MEPNVVLGYLKRGIALSLSFFGHEQYHFNSQNEWKPWCVFINMNLSPFSLKEKERKYVLWHICANFNLPPKSTLGLILISLKMCKKSKKIVVSISLNSKTLVLNNINNYRNINLQILIYII